MLIWLLLIYLVAGVVVVYFVKGFVWALRILAVAAIRGDPINLVTLIKAVIVGILTWPRFCVQEKGSSVQENGGAKKGNIPISQ